MQEPKISKLNDGYLSDSSLVFQSWFKDISSYVETIIEIKVKKSNYLKILLPIRQGCK